MKSPKYLRFIGTLQCCNCGGDEAIPHHVIGLDSNGCMGGKASDLMSMPICEVRGCHSEIHKDPTSYPQTRWIEETLEKAYLQGLLKIV